MPDERRQNTYAEAKEMQKSMSDAADKSVSASGRSFAG